MKHLTTFESFENPTNEGFLGFGKKSREEALGIIDKHPAKRKIYNDLLKKSEDEKAEKYVEFIRKNPDVNYVNWDDKKGKWVEGGKFSDSFSGN